MELMRKVEAARQAGLEAATMDPEAALSAYQRFASSVFEAEAFLSSLVPELLKDDPGKAVDFLAKLPAGGTKMRWLGEALVGYAMRDPSAATQKLAALLRPAEDPFLYARVAATWAEKDPQAAFSWIRSFDPELSDSGTATGMALTVWAQKNPREALEYVSRADWIENHHADSVIRVAATSLADHNPEEAARWAIAQQDQGGTADPLAMVFMSWAARQPAQAADFALKEIKTTEHMATAVQSIARGWAQSDPQAALRWAQSLPEKTPGAAAALSDIQALIQMQQQIKTQPRPPALDTTAR